jgi:ATP-binding cassette subfamily F protein 3
MVVEPGRFRVIEGNYETYQLLIQSGLAAGPAATKSEGKDPKPKSSKPEKRDPQSAEERPAKKRRFSYRKVTDLEQEILERETRIEKLHALLSQPETHRDGDRVRALKTEIAQQQEALESLYAHWEEAVELNW